jgi:hypothetical protein
MKCADCTRWTLSLPGGGIRRVTTHSAIRLHPHLIEGGQDIRTIQELLSERDVSTTMLNTHVRNRGPMGVRSPAE